MGLLIYNGVRITPEVGDIVITTKRQDPTGIILFPIGAVCKITDIGYSVNWKTTKYRLVRIDDDYVGWWYTEKMFEYYQGGSDENS